MLAGGSAHRCRREDIRAHQIALPRAFSPWRCPLFLSLSPLKAVGPASTEDGRPGSKVSFGGMDVSEAKRLKAAKEENAKDAR